MFREIVLLAIIATVYGIPTIQTATAEIPTTTPVIYPAAALPALQREVQSYEKKSTVVPLSKTETKPVDVINKAVNGEEDPKNEKEELEGAEFGWGLPRWGGWGYPLYQTYYPAYYPTYYPTYYPSYQEYQYY